MESPQYPTGPAPTSGSAWRALNVARQSATISSVMVASEDQRAPNSKKGMPGPPVVRRSP